MPKLVLTVLFVSLLAVLAWGASAQAGGAANAINLGDLRIVNGYTSLGGVDVYIDGVQMAYALPPERATTFFAVPVGRHSVAVRLAGADALSAPLADVLVDVSANQSYTAISYQQQFAGGERTPPLAQSGAFLILNDDRSPIDVGRTRLTAAHLFPGVTGPLSITYPDRSSLLHEISPEQPYGTIDVGAGVYALAVVDAGSADLNRLYLGGQYAFNSSTLYTLVIVPDAAAAPAAAPALNAPPLAPAPRLFIVSAPIDPPAEGIRLRLIHAAHNTAVFDLFIDERLALPRMTYSDATEYLGIPGYSHTITLRRRDAAPNEMPFATARLDITPENLEQQHWTILLLNANQGTVTTMPLAGENQARDAGRAGGIVNTPGGPLVLALLPDNIAQTPRGEARVRLYHAIDGALDISLFTPALPPILLPGVTPTPPPTPVAPPPPVRLLEPVIYGAEANDANVRAGLYTELNFVAGGSTEVYRLNNKPLIPGVVYTFVLIGQPGGEPPVQALQLEDFGRGIPQDRLYLGEIISSTDVNVRDAPVNSANVRARLPNNTVVEVLGRNFDGTWVYIGYQDPASGAARSGWLFAQLVSVTRLGDPLNVLSLPLVNP